jgi:predicted DNA-binding transcriptional regulator AlpA
MKQIFEQLLAQKLLAQKKVEAESSGGQQYGSIATPSSLIFLDQTAAADLLGLSPRTLERFRLEGTGPPFHKFGRRVRYALSDIEEWASAQKRTSTSQSGETR